MQVRKALQNIKNYIDTQDGESFAQFLKAEIERGQVSNNVNQKTIDNLCNQILREPFNEIIAMFFKVIITSKQKNYSEAYKLFDNMLSLEIIFSKLTKLL